MTFGPVEALNKPTAKTKVATMAIESLERDQSVDALISIQTHRISTPAGPSSATNGHSGNTYLNHQGRQNPAPALSLLKYFLIVCGPTFHYAMIIASIIFHNRTYLQLWKHRFVSWIACSCVWNVLYHAVAWLCFFYFRCAKCTEPEASY